MPSVRQVTATGIRSAANSLDQREHHVGSAACDRYMAALRRTSFSCSSSRMGFFALRNSAASAWITPGVMPSLTSAILSQRCRQDPKRRSLSNRVDRGFAAPRDRDDVGPEILTASESTRPTAVPPVDRYRSTRLFHRKCTIRRTTDAACGSESDEVERNGRASPPDPSRHKGLPTVSRSARKRGRTRQRARSAGQRRRRVSQSAGFGSESKQH